MLKLADSTVGQTSIWPVYLLLVGQINAFLKTMVYCGVLSK